MVNGPASNSNTLVDELLKMKRDKAKSFGIARQNFSGIGSSIGGAGSKGGDSAKGGSGEAYLKTGGDTMIGPIAYYPKAGIISGGVLDIGLDSSAYSTRVIVTGQGGLDDDLDTIANVAHAGQMLYLQPILTNDITLKHNTDNIFNPQGTDVVVAGGQTVILQWDTVVHANKWVILTGNGVTGAGDNLGDHTATEALDMATFNIGGVGTILFDTLVGGVQTIGPVSSGLEFRTVSGNDFSWWIAGTEEYTMTNLGFTFGSNKLILTSGHEIFDSGSTLTINAGGGVSQFIQLETNSFGRLLIADEYVSLANGAEFRAVGNEIFLDADNDTKWQAGTDDVAQLTVGVNPSSSKLVMSVSETSTILYNTLIMTNQPITNIGTTMEFQTNVSISGDNGVTPIIDFHVLANDITTYMDIVPDTGATGTLNLGGAGANENFNTVYADRFNAIAEGYATSTPGYKRGLNDEIYVDIPTPNGSFDVRENGLGPLGITTAGSDPWMRFHVISNGAFLQLFGTGVAGEDTTIKLGTGVDSSTIIYDNDGDLLIDNGQGGTTRGVRLTNQGLGGLNVRSDRIYANEPLDMVVNNIEETKDILNDADVLTARNVGSSTGPADAGYNFFVRDKIAWAGLPNDTEIRMGNTGIDIETNSASDDIRITTLGTTSDIFANATTGEIHMQRGGTNYISLTSGGVTFSNAAPVFFNNDVTVGANWIDINDIATPANPALGTRRLFVDNGTGELSVRTNGGTTVSLESGGGGATVLDDLTDVNIGTPAANTVLVWGGVTWGDALISNANISGSAAIAQSKLNLSITDSEVNSSANISVTKISGTAVNLSSSQTITGTKIFNNLTQAVWLEDISQPSRTTNHITATTADFIINCPDGHSIDFRYDDGAAQQTVLTLGELSCSFDNTGYVNFWQVPIEMQDTTEASVGSVGTGERRIFVNTDNNEKLSVKTPHATFGGEMQYVEIEGHKRGSISTDSINGYMLPQEMIEMVDNELLTGNRMYAIPWIPQEDCQTAEVAIRLGTSNAASTGSNAVIGIYTNSKSLDDGNYPNQKLGQTSQIDMVGTSITREASLQVNVRGGELYWIVFHQEDLATEPSVTGFNGASMMKNIIPYAPSEMTGAAANEFIGWHVSSTYSATMPTSFPSFATKTDSIIDPPGVFVRCILV